MWTRSSARDFLAVLTQEKTAGRWVSKCYCSWIRIGFSGCFHLMHIITWGTAFGEQTSSVTGWAIAFKAERLRGLIGPADRLWLAHAEIAALILLGVTSNIPPNLHARIADIRIDLGAVRLALPEPHPWPPVHKACIGFDRLPFRFEKVFEKMIGVEISI